MTSQPLQAQDLSPIETTNKDEPWLARLQRHLDDTDYTVRLGSAVRDDDPVITRDAYGSWWAGRYIGDVRFEGRTLRIRPRLGPQTIIEWLGAVTNIVAVPDTATRDDGDHFIARLLAAVWCQTVDRASRHGPPAFRADRSHEGLHVRGALDVRGTVALRARGSVHVRSVARFRDLDNDVARVIMAAEHVLRRHIGDDRWHTERSRDIVGQLAPVVGSRPAVPTIRDLRRVRYTPITRAYADAAQFSHRVASQGGIALTSESGSGEGILLDVAELWELFLAKVVARALPEFKVQHGTLDDPDRDYLLRSPASSARMGRLVPDILVRTDDDTVVAVLDAKYKRLTSRRERRDGVDRGDLYQLASYLSRYDPGGEATGALLYPEVLTSEQPTGRAQQEGPWRTENGSTVLFETVPVTVADAVSRIAAILSPIGDEPSASVAGGPTFENTSSDSTAEEATTVP